jgi:DNA polymerase-3 subunit beta
MQITATAKSLAAALNLASSAADGAKKQPALGAAHLAAGAERFSVTANNLDHVLTLSIPATIERVGELAVSAQRLAAPVAGFPADAEIAISSGDKMANIACGRSRFQLPMLPVKDLPPRAKIDQEIGRIEIGREDLLRLLSKPAFASSTEKSRYYLNGILLHDTDAGLAAVATDGHRLARVVLPRVTGLSQDRRLIVPRPAIRIITRLVADKAIEALTLCRSKTLIEIASATFAFVSKLIDGTFPDYEHLIPVSSSNAAIVDRAALVRAVARVVAVAPDARPLIGLTWQAQTPALQLVVPDAREIADDPVEAETSGIGRIAVQIHHLQTLLGELEGDRVRIDADTSAGSPILITDPDEANFTIVQMPCAWKAQAQAA